MEGQENKMPSHSYGLVIAIFIWTAIVLGSLSWNRFNESHDAVKLAENEATAYLNKDLAVRYWAAFHGGVYVPITEDTPPNPGLSHIPERDITTPSGKKLTLMNPAYILSQLMNDYSDMYGAKEKITSFPDKLLNSKNMPDQWELSALNSFNKGAFKVSAIIDIDDVPHFRLMKPLFIQNDCLKCHGFQGNKVGDLQGGLSVSVPMTLYLDNEQKSTYYHNITHGLFWFIGVICLVYYFRQARAHEQVLQHMNQKLEGLSFRDGLTGAANRRMLDLMLHQEWARCMREKQPLSLIMFDIDYFKEYNDRYGHLKGDECLKIVASILCEVPKRGTDACSRYGGEEFSILLPNTDLKEATRLAEQCRKNIFALSIPHETSKASDVLTISAGISTMVPSTDTPFTLLIEAADVALYRAKHAGRNRVESSRESE